MKTSAFCPISNKKINEKVARLNAGFTILVLLIYAFTQSIITVIILGIDFFIRGSESAQYSPIRALSKFTVESLHLKPQYVNEGPKKFAARIGFVFSVLVIIAQIAGLPITANIIASIFGICAFLEGVFGFCIACRIYPFAYKLFYRDSFTVSI
jgi:hypothetical protein